MKIIATYNIKGGVGKTATAVNLAYNAAQRGAQTLVWDLDPQGASTYYFRVKPKVKGGGEKLVRGKRGISSRIRGTDFDGLDLLPADFSYRNLDVVLDDLKRPERQLSRMLKPMSKEYDWVILDCSPNISLISESVFNAVDALVVPTIPTTLSMRTLATLEDHLHGRKKKPKVLPFFSKVHARNSVHRKLCRPGSKSGRYRFLDTAIPQSMVIEKMGLQRAPVPSYAPRSKSATAYRKLWREIEHHVR